MKVVYEAQFRLDLGKAIPEIGQMVNRLNDILSRDGYDEKLVLTDQGIIPPMVVTANRELTEQEQETMKKILREQMQVTFPQYGVELHSFRRQSGNVQQSVV